MARQHRNLGSSPETHLEEMSRRVNQASREYERALGYDKCEPALLTLIDARDSVSRAHENMRAGGHLTRRRAKALYSLSKKINEAIFNFAKGPCMRRSPYDKG